MSKQNWNQPVKDFVSNWLTYFKTMGIRREDIIIDDIYHLGGLGTSQSSIQIKNQGMTMADLDEDVSKVVENIKEIYEENIKDKEAMLEKSRTLYETTAVQTMVDVSLDDGFNNFKEDKDFVITYEPEQDEIDSLGEKFVEEIQDEIDDFVEKSSLKDIVSDLLPEVIRDGEHALALRVEQGKGVTGINDDLDVKTMLPYYRGNKLTLVMEKTTEKTSFSEQERLRIYKPENIVFFRLNHFNKKRIKLDCIPKESKEAFKKKTGLEIPKYIRVCLPLYYSALDDIETLQTMEKLSEAQGFVDLLRSQVIGLGVPANTTSEDAKKAIREYERHLNDVKNVLGSFKDMEVDDLIGLASERKLLPLFGDGKGAITPIELNTGNKVAESRDSVANQRNMIALTTGFPAYYFTNTEAPQDKATALKLYSRFTKKLSGLQVCLADGTRDILDIHLKAKGKNIKKSNIKVKFKALTNGDVLDEVDVMVATVTGLADMYDALEKISSSENNELVVDSDTLLKIWDIYTSNLVNMQGLLKKDPNKFNDMDGFSDLDGFGGGMPRAPRGGSSAMPRPSASEQPSAETEDGGESELTPDQEARIDRANAESEADFVNSTSAELG